MSKIEVKGDHLGPENSEPHKSFGSRIYRYIPGLGPLLLLKQLQRDIERKLGDIGREFDKQIAEFEREFGKHIAERHQSLDDEPVPPPLDAPEDEIQRYKEEVLRQAMSPPSGKKTALK